MGCGWRAFGRFEEELGQQFGTGHDVRPVLRFVGSGDFHHVTLALLRRLAQPSNLLVLDNHSDWMRGLPILHCGTWLYHAARLPQVVRVFHVGGDADFDNGYRWLAPWSMLQSGKITVVPARRRFATSRWDGLPHAPLRQRPEAPARRDRIEEVLWPWREELASRPLYVSLDRDVMPAEDAVVNWDSGHLRPAEVFGVIEAFAQASGGLAGMDVVGDWSRVEVRGAFRRLLHWCEHPNLRIDPPQAQLCNEELNLALVECCRRAGGSPAREPEPATRLLPR